MKRIKELDGLRAIAILLVMSCHYPGFVRLSRHVSEFGWVGVDIFFALSGYLITTILLGLRDSPHPYATFYGRRAIRIFPPYFAVTFLIIFLGIITHHRAIMHAKYVIAQVLFLQSVKSSYLPFLLSWLAHPVQMLVNLPALLSTAHHLPYGETGLPPALKSQSGTYWSLSIEEFFYLFWAPTVLLLRRRFIASIGIAICVVEALLRWSYGGNRAYYGVFFRFDGLIYGALLALLLAHWKRTRLPSWTLGFFSLVLTFSVAGLAVILLLLWPVVGLEIRDSPLFLAFGLPLISLSCTAIIGIFIMRAESDWWVARLMRIGPMQRIGTISYTMYLVEILTMSLVCHLPGQRWDPTQPLWRLLIQAILAVALTIGVAQLSWVFLESPLQRWKNARLKEPSVAQSLPETV